MSQLQKIDYHNLTDKNEEPSSDNEREEKISSFSSIRMGLRSMDIKNKIEIVVLFLVLIITMGISIYYFVNQKEANIPANLYAPGVEADL